MTDEVLETVVKYTHLVEIFDELLNFMQCAPVLAESADQALSCTIFSLTT